MLGNRFGEEEKKRLLIGAGLSIILLLTVFLAARFSPAKNIIEESEDAIEKEASDPFDYSNVIKIEDLEEVDLFVKDHSPNAKKKGMQWDDRFFNELEGTESSGSDKYIAKCAREEHLFIDKYDGQELFCDVYMDRNTWDTYKIVTRKESYDGLWEVIDYYYQDGKPYFIFKRYETIYTPSYASLEKPGTRLYFRDDVLVRSQIVLDGTLKVSQTGLSLQRNPAYEEFDYYTAPLPVKEQYDSFEIEWLNKAYNLLEAAKNSQGIGRIRGRVTDSKGQAMAGARVVVKDKESGEVKYAVETAEDGTFSFLVYQDLKKYSLIATAGDGYRDMLISELALDKRASEYEYYDLVLYQTGLTPSQVALNIHDAETFKTEIPFDAGLAAHVKIREGYNNTEGETVFDGDTDSNGYVEVELPQGAYTVETESTGYVTEWANMDVSQFKMKKQLYTVKCPEADMAKVLLTWDSDVDLDLTFFTPYHGIKGDSDHIGGYRLKDDYGNYITADNAYGCEVGYVNIPGCESYRVYATSYPDIMSGAYGAGTLKDSNAKVYVFYPDGSVEACDLSCEGNGVVWEAVEFCQKNYSTYNHLYSKLGGKTWWLADKGIAKEQQSSDFRSDMQVTGRLKKEYNDTEEEYYLTFDSPITIFLEDESGKGQYQKVDEIALLFDPYYTSNITEHLDLYLGQYMTGTIKKAGYTPKGEPVLSIQSMTVSRDITANRSEVVPSGYKDFLEKRLKEGQIAYTLADINNNNIPELVVIDPNDKSYESGAKIYTCESGEVELIGSFGTEGGYFTYFPLQNFIMDESVSGGVYRQSFCFFDEHSVYWEEYEKNEDPDGADYTFYSNWYDMIGTDTVYAKVRVDEGVELSALEYQKALESKFQNIDRNTGKFVDVYSCVAASRIENIEFDED